MFHESTFEYLNPSDDQKDQMTLVRRATKAYADVLVKALPDGPDKTYVLRKVREVGMWANVAITREADGTPRPGAQVWKCNCVLTNTFMDCPVHSNALK